jgi:hypothetical protein
MSFSVPSSGAGTPLPAENMGVPTNNYLHRIDVTLTLTSGIAVGDTVINVGSSTGVVAGEAITIYEGKRMSQFIVAGTTATTITINPSSDFAYTTAALVESGPWNMAVDGSVTPQIFTIKCPPSGRFYIHAFNHTILDQSVMDDAKFGGLTALTNGIVVRRTNGGTKNLSIIVNNTGFYEFGYDTSYSAKAPAGYYGFKARKDLGQVNGITGLLKGADDDEFQLIVNDDLTGLDQFTCNIHGYIK